MNSYVMLDFVKCTVNDVKVTDDVMGNIFVAFYV